MPQIQNDLEDYQQLENEFLESDFEKQEKIMIFNSSKDSENF